MYLRGLLAPVGRKNGWQLAEAARSLDALEASLGPALDTITAEDARGWFRLAGYPAPE